jgi:uncharacterized membrane protein
MALALQRLTLKGQKRRNTKKGEEQSIMERMLVVVFDTERQAYEGKKALTQLDDEGSISIHASAVISKNVDGKVTVKQSDDQPPIATLLGTPLGSLIGLLGGPVGLAVGTAVGLVGGITADLNNARINGDFVDDVNSDLLPNKFAVVAQIDEDWTTPVDTRMEALGGTVFRRALKDVKQTIHDEDVAAMKADMAQMKAEMAKSQADRKAKLQTKINELDSKIQARLERDKQQRQAAELQAKAHAETLKRKAETLKAKAAEIHN